MAKSGRIKRASSQAELDRLEELLGEEFESVSEARKALKAETGTAPYKDSYTVKELSSRKHGTVKAFIEDISGRADEIDALKHPGDFWAAEIYGNGTYDLFGSIEQLGHKLASYRGLQEEHPRAALKNIRLIRVSGVNALADYREQKKRQVEESWRLSKLKGKVNRTRTRQQKRRLEKQAARIKQLQAEVRRLKRKGKRI